MMPILEAHNLTKHFVFKKGFRGRQFLKAVDGISFKIDYGETLGLVGESGCGKSTTARLVMRLIEATAGKVSFEGKQLLDLSASRLNEIKKEMQIVFQDPLSSLNPRMSIHKIIEEPLVVHRVRDKQERKKRVEEALTSVGLSPAHHSERYPSELSGGQRQRVSIARAMVLKPKMIICDEPVSALDVSIQSQILNLLQLLKREFNLSYLFVSHDLSVVKHIADNVAVMYAGRIVEKAPKHLLFSNPLHPYTKGLFSSIPVPNPRIAREKKGTQFIEGEVPDLFNLPLGCNFYPRCLARIDRCRFEDPSLEIKGHEHSVACLLL